MAGQLSASQIEVIRSALKLKKISQVKFAAALHVDASMVSRWLNGAKAVTDENIRAIERVLSLRLPEAQKFELYLAAPITGLEPTKVPEHRDAVERVSTAAAEHVEGVFWPGSEIRSLENLGTSDLASERNLRILEQAAALLYIQFSEMVSPSGALIELGIALGMRIKTTIILHEQVRRPFMLKHGFDGVAGRLKFLPDARVYYVKTVEEAVGLVAHGGRGLMGID